MPFLQLADIPFTREIDGDEPGWMPRSYEQQLVERSAVEPSESPRRLRAEKPFRRRSCLEPVPQPLVGRRRDHHTVQLKRRIKPLAFRDDVELDPIAAFEA